MLRAKDAKFLSSYNLGLQQAYIAIQEAIGRGEFFAKVQLKVGDSDKLRMMGYAVSPKQEDGASIISWDLA